MKKVLISAALTGTAGSKSASPHVPISAEEIAADAVACAKAGASIVHIHVHDETGAPTMKTEYFTQAFEAVKEATAKAGVDIIINLTSSGGGDGGDDLRMAHLRKLRPEMCSYDAGTLNWAGDGVFMNTPQFLFDLGKCAIECGVKPEVEVFDTTMIKNAVRYAKRSYLLEPLHFQFVMGAYGGMDSTVDNLLFLRNMLPEQCTFSVSGIGPGAIPMMLTALALGADGLRVGLEDNLYLHKGVLATNAQLVEQAVSACRLTGREPATPDEARAILGITRHALREYTC